jgi:D-alanyl-D-alanine carboxypeptidase
MLGHYAYKEAPQAELEAIVADGSIRMRRAAARSYRDMVAAAQQEGVSLTRFLGSAQSTISVISTST